MTPTAEPLPPFLAEAPRLGTEISVTGKWTPTKPGGRFRTSAESKEMVAEWNDIHMSARTHEGVRSTEVNHAVGDDAVLVHHVFDDADAMVEYFSTTAAQHHAALTRIATPGHHFVRGVDVPPEARDAIASKGVPVTFGEWIYGYVRDDYRRPDPETAVQVTAKWTARTDDDLAALRHWWQRVGTDAFEIESGLLRFETYQVPDEAALIIHETFVDSDELKFHLSKGTAHRYKSDIDEIAAPEAYFFRGPVAWSIRTYSKFMRLPATYSSRGLHHTRSGGSFSDGVVA